MPCQSAADYDQTTRGRQTGREGTRHKRHQATASDSRKIPDRSGKLAAHHRPDVGRSRAIAPSLRESAEALGLPPRARLWRIELPIASPSILAGIKTSAVINVGTATLGALIGAGGYGQPILTGIRLDDTPLILLGAVPAAALALLVQGGFEVVERVVVPRGLRMRRET